jgi:hypothetical protein
MPAQARPGAGAADEARRLLSRGDAKGAAAVLEEALPGATAADRPALIDALRDAYDAAARKAEADGRKADAEAYRDNLEILGRKSPSASPPAPAREPDPAPKPDPTDAPASPVSDPNPVKSAESPAPPAIEAPQVDRASEPPAPPQGPAASLPEPPPLPPPTDVRVKPAASQPADHPAQAKGHTDPDAPEVTLPRGRVPAAAPTTPTLQEADTAFVAGRYADAGRVYFALDRAGTLPPDRRGHWAYCRAVDVVRRINARPASAREWASIDSEIQAIRALSPSNWIGEYLRNLASERTRDGRSRSARSNKLVLRGNSPDEPTAPAQPQPIATPAPAARVSWSPQPVTTTNFQVVHVEKDRELAQRIAQAAEAARKAQMKRWNPATASTPWSPRCEIVLFPTAAEFCRETLQPADSPGFSTMGMNGGRIVMRRVHLRADHPNLVKAILPHEVTHVVLADLFPHQQIPRWADEGMAVLAEPRDEQAVRAADLDEPLRSGQLFRVDDLMTMDYPEPKHWPLYYAQSVSLTRFLVESGSPDQFIRFVQEAQRGGFETALRQVYGIPDFNELHSRWLVYARDHTAATAEVASSSSDRNPSKPPAPPRR